MGRVGGILLVVSGRNIQLGEVEQGSREGCRHWGWNCNEGLSSLLMGRVGGILLVVSRRNIQLGEVEQGSREGCRHWGWE